MSNTPGPYYVGEMCALHIDVNSDLRTVARIPFSPTWIKEAEANAKLIAAAPELLEALKMFLVVDEIGDGDLIAYAKKCTQTARKLIARIEK